jgi:RecB family endonuclease NucS
MAIYQVTGDSLTPVPQTSFARAGMRERAHLQQLLRSQIEVIAPGTMIISEEFGNWEDSRRRIDLLGIDKEANLVVFELKRTSDGGHMELQAVRYAAMVAAMTFEGAVEVFEHYLAATGQEDDARERLTEFLEWDEVDEDQFAQDVRIVLVAADFSKEITTAVLWLNDHGLDIRCIRLRPYDEAGKLLLDIQQVIPLPEAEEYQIRIREKSRLERRSRTQSRDMTKYDVTIGSDIYPGLAKRQAIFQVVQHLCATGVDPEVIRQTIAWKKSALRDCEGILDANSFTEKLAEQLRSEGKKAQVKRYFIADDELIHANGRTYAFTRMWGPRTIKAIRELLEAFPDAGISVEPSDGGDEA